MPFHIIKNERKLIYKFPFDLTFSIVKAIIAIVFFIVALFHVKWNSIDYSFFIGYFFLVCIFMYLSFASYIEWRRNGRRLIENKDKQLYINNKKIINFHQVKSIVIDYNGASIDTGWFVYLEFYLHQDFVLKEQLSSKEACEFASAIATFFNVDILKLG